MTTKHSHATKPRRKKAASRVDVTPGIHRAAERAGLRPSQARDLAPVDMHAGDARALVRDLDEAIGNILEGGDILTLDGLKLIRNVRTVLDCSIRAVAS